MAWNSPIWQMESPIQFETNCFNILLEVKYIVLILAKSADPDQMPYPMAFNQDPPVHCLSQCIRPQFPHPFPTPTIKKGLWFMLHCKVKID